jgi:hypothetical protein
MNRLFVLLFALALGSVAQRIEIETPSRDKVVRIQTAMNHLTVIEFAEPVNTVAVGSPSFRVERRENKVFIQPLEEGVSTNLFIWTAATRLSYELVPAVTDAGRMDFAIDYRQPPPTTSAPTVSAPPAEKSSIPEDWALRSTPVNQVGFGNRDSATVNVTVRDVYRDGDRVFIRYFIENHSAAPYRPGPPTVVSLHAPTAKRSLYPMTNSQIGDQSGLHYAGTEPVLVLHTDQSAALVSPGDGQTGVVTVRLDKDATRPTVLELRFPTASNRKVTAALVL